MAFTSSKKNIGMKRKRVFSPEEKLAHKGSKEIQHELKKVKAFEIQKLVKKLRTLRESSEGTHSEKHVRTKEAEKVQKLEEEMRVLKSINLKNVLQKALSQIGLLQYANLGTTEAEDPTDATSDQGVSLESSPVQATEVARLENFLLTHSKMAALLSSYDKSATELRRNKLLEQDGLGDSKSLTSSAVKKRQKYNEHKTVRRPARDHQPNKRREAPASAFVTSLSGVVVDSDTEEHNTRIGFQDNYDSDGVLKDDGRRNRPGQRERKRRGLVREIAKARKEGKDVQVLEQQLETKAGSRPRGPPADQSKRHDKKPLHSKKPHKDDKMQDGGPKDNKSSQKNGASKSKPTVDSNAHPSWVAKQALKEKEKSGVGAFAGKKITFNDD